MKNEVVGCSINTIMKYLGYLEEAYLISKIKKYSTKVKKELNYYHKIYNEDVSFNSLRVVNNLYDLKHNLENIIYNELLYRGYELYVYNDYDKYRDFLTCKNGKSYYIQVAYSIAEDKAYQREFDAFRKIDNLSQKIIITKYDIDYSTSVIKHIKLKDFLLLEDL